MNDGMRPSQLGGMLPGTAHPGSPMAIATVNRRYRDDRTHKHLLEVKLDGGRIIRNVEVGRQGSGAASGAQPRLPSVGEQGVVLFPSFPRTGSRAVWALSLDHYFHGLEVQDAQDQLEVHPSGAASVTDARGASTRRLVGGDTLYLGPEGEAPYPLKARTRNFAESGEVKALDDLDEGRRTGPLEILLSGARHVRRMAAELFEGRGRARLDTGTGELQAFVALEGGVGAEAYGKAGERVRLAARNGRASGGVNADLEESRATLWSDAHGHAALHAHGDDVELDAEMTYVGRPGTDFAFLASAPPTQENFQALVRYTGALSDRIARLEARWVLATKLLPVLTPVLAIPLPVTPRAQMKDVDAPNVQAERGGGL